MLATKIIFFLSIISIHHSCSNTSKSIYLNIENPKKFQSIRDEQGFWKMIQYCEKIALISTKTSWEKFPEPEIFFEICNSKYGEIDSNGNWNPTDLFYKDAIKKGW